jgi:hypothetical protein
VAELGVRLAQYGQQAVRAALWDHHPPQVTAKPWAALWDHGKDPAGGSRKVKSPWCHTAPGYVCPPNPPGPPARHANCNASGFFANHPTCDCHCYCTVCHGLCGNGCYDKCHGGVAAQRSAACKGNVLYSVDEPRTHSYLHHSSHSPPPIGRAAQQPPKSRGLDRYGRGGGLLSVWCWPASTTLATREGGMALPLHVEALLRMVHTDPMEVHSPLYCCTVYIIIRIDQFGPQLKFPHGRGFPNGPTHAPSGRVNPSSVRACRSPKTTFDRIFVRFLYESPEPFRT